MTNAKHTPGPWRVEHEDNYIPDDWQEKPVQVVGADSTVIACNTAFYPTALDPANARLIAAAPEMRVFLDHDQWQIIGRAIERHSAGEISDPHALGLIAAGFMKLDVMRIAAIAKAEGAR